MMIAVGSPVIYRPEDDIVVHGTIESIDGVKYKIVTAIGAVWWANIGEVTRGLLRIDERKLPENLPHVEKCESDHANDGPYFWRNEVEGVKVQYCSTLTDKTPHWCDWHEWATDMPCQLCEKGMQFL